MIEAYAQVTRQGEHGFDTVATTRNNPPWSTGPGTDCDIATIALFYLLLLYFIHFSQVKIAMYRVRH